MDQSSDMSDNCNVNVYHAGDKYIAATESDFVHIFSSESLESIERVCALRCYGLYILLCYALNTLLVKIIDTCDLQ